MVRSKKWAFVVGKGYNTGKGRQKDREK